MLKEDYVSFEVAKLLKEKGFDWICGGYWYSKENNTEKGFAVSSLPANHNDDEYRRFDLPISAPTHQMAMKWLREKYKIIFVFKPASFSGEDCTFWTYELWCGDNFEGEILSFKTYEEAVEAALKYSLENLSVYGSKRTNDWGLGI